MRKWHYTIRPLWHFLCAASSKPIRRQWKAFHWRSWPLPHSVIAELEAWWIVVQDNVLLLDWMLCFDLNRCPWSLNNGWYINNQSGYPSSILHLLPCQSEHQGEGNGGKDGIRGDKSLSSLSPYGSPVTVTLGVAACLLSYPQSSSPVTRWLQSLEPGRQPAPSKPFIQQNGGNTITSGPQLIIKSPQPQRAQHLHLNGRLPSEALV